MSKKSNSSIEDLDILTQDIIARVMRLYTYSLGGIEMKKLPSYRRVCKDIVAQSQYIRKSL